MRAEVRTAEIGLMIAWDGGYKKVHLQLDSLTVVTAIMGTRRRTPDMVICSLPLMSSVVETGKSQFSTSFAKGNKVADLLAHHRHTLDFGFHVNCTYPHEVDRAVWSDHVGTCFPRTIPMNE
ncbi:hypothetical protein LINPERHAP1_LOCUS20861 [Linum perenne]